MGAGESLTEKAMHHGIQEFNADFWQPSPTILKRTSSTAKLHVVPDECKPTATYSSATHAFLVDEYILQTADVPNIDDYLAEIEWRNQCEYLVNVKYIKGFSAPFICETDSNKNCLYIEHIPLRLSQITDIPFPDNLYLLKACLKGFYYIFLHTYALDIKEDQICLNQQGKVKVWMNVNLAKNVPAITNIFKSHKKSELIMVREIIDIIDQNTDHQFEPKNFKEYLREQKLQNLTFAQSIEAVEQFASTLQIAIPSSLESVNDLFDPLVNNRLINSSRQCKANSYYIGRGAQTIETRMLESLPIHQSRSSNHPINNGAPQFIKYVDTYHCPRQIINTASHIPTKTVHYPVKVNFITKSLENPPTTVSHESPLKQIPKSQSEMFHESDEEWKYFDANGWLQIDPDILLDLKRISSMP